MSREEMLTAEAVAAVLMGKPTASGGWMARCPSHDDRTASLSIAEGAGGKLLLKCHAHCEFEDILAAVDNESAREASKAPSKKQGFGAASSSPIVATYDYCDVNGTLLYQAVRSEPKSFWQRRPDGKGGWINNMKGITRVPYRLPEWYGQNSKKPIIIVEGEKDADTVCALGLLGTTVMGGASAWRDELAAWFTDRTVIIIPDNDEAGEKFATAVYASLVNVDAYVKIVRLPGLAEKGDISDWVEAGGTKKQLIEISKSTPQLSGGAAMSETIEVAEVDTCLPRPLTRVGTTLPLFPLDALGPVLGAAAKVAAECIQADPGVCGTSILAAAALACQPHANVELDGRTYPLSLWFLTIAESGERKSAVDNLVLVPHREYEAVQCERRRIERADIEQRMRIYDNNVSRIGKGKKSDHESDVAALKQLGKRPEFPPSGILVMAEPTLESVHKEFLAGASSLGLFSDEGGQFFGGFSMGKEHAMGAISGLSKLWDNGSGERVRASEVPQVYRNRRFSSHLMVQGIIANRVFGNSLLSGQGFLARTLVCKAKAMAGTRIYKRKDAMTSPEVEFYYNAVNTLFGLPYPTAGKSTGELKPRTIGLSEAATSEWIRVYDMFEAGIVDKYATIKPWASKAAEQVIRIAGVLTLFENPYANEIPEDAIVRATKIVMYYMDCTLAETEETALPEAVRNALGILAWCKKKKLTEVTSEDTLHYGPIATRTASVRDAAMKVLVEHGWAVQRGAKKAWTIRIDVDSRGE